MKMTNKQITALNYVTSDDYVTHTNDDYFYNLHINIIDNYFYSKDWSWNDVIKYWNKTDIDDAISIYKVDNMAQ